MSSQLIDRYNELSAALYRAEQSHDEDGCQDLARIYEAENEIKDFEAAHPELTNALIGAAYAR